MNQKNLLQEASPMRFGRGLLEITSTTIDELAELHLSTCARFAERNVDGVGEIFKAKDFADFVDKQRRQLEALRSDRQRYLGTASKIIRRAVEQANELWSDPPEPPAIIARPKPEPAPPAAIETPADIADVQVAPSKPSPAEPLFELFEDQCGEHRFRLLSAEGVELLTSESYKSKKGARNGIEVARKNAQRDDRFECIETDSGLPMFNLKAGNHQVVGTSTPYQSSAEMRDALQMVQTASATAQIADS